MIPRAEDRSDAAKSFALSPQLMLENEAGRKMNLAPERAASYRSRSSPHTRRGLSGPAV